jgi:hypothetical protein
MTKLARRIFPGGPPDAHQLSTRVPASLLKALKIAGVERGVPMRQLFEEAIREKLAREAARGEG